MVLEQARVSHGWKLFASDLNWIIWSVFAAEIVVLLAITSDRQQWLRAHVLEVAIVVLTPPFLPASLQALRLFRLLRVLRLAVLVRQCRRIFTLDGVRFAAVLTVVAALGGGALFTSLEKGYSTWDGVWWATTTMTTVGYGDVTPHTTPSRILAIVLMLVGLAFVSLVTGAVAQRFMHAQIDNGADAPSGESAAITAVLGELREIRLRLVELERAIERTRS